MNTINLSAWIGEQQVGTLSYHDNTGRFLLHMSKHGLHKQVPTPSLLRYPSSALISKPMSYTP